MTEFLFSGGLSL